MTIWSEHTDFGKRTDKVNQIKLLCSMYSDILSFVSIFGSTARNDFTDNSDIDLYIESEHLTTTQLLTHKRYRDFEYRLFDIVSDLIEFDLLSYGRNELKSVRDSKFFSSIEKDGVILYDTRTKDV